MFSLLSSYTLCTKIIICILNTVKYHVLCRPTLTPIHPHFQKKKNPGKTLVIYFVQPRNGKILNQDHNSQGL